MIRWRISKAARARAAAPLAIAAMLGGWVLAAGPSVDAQTNPIKSTLVATQEMSALPDGVRWVVRNEHQTNVEHSHVGGFVYTLSGSSTLRLEGDEIPLSEGEGTWVPTDVPHTHVGERSTRLWTFSLERQPDASAGPPIFVSRELVGAVPGPYLARLLADEYAAGAATPMMRSYGPEMVYVRDGRYELTHAENSQSFDSGQGYLIDPLVPHELRNATQAVSRLFGLSLVPLGRPASDAMSPDEMR